MKFSDRFTIFQKLIPSYLFIGLIPLILITIFFTKRINIDLTNAAFKNIDTINHQRKSQIESLFINMRTDLTLLKDSIEVYLQSNKITNINQALKNKRFIDYLAKFKEFKREKNLLILSPDGQIKYSLNKQYLNDNISNKKFNQTSLYTAFKMSTNSKGIKIADFSPFTKSSSKEQSHLKSHPQRPYYAAFLTIQVEGFNRKKAAVLALQISAEQLNTIVNNRQDVNKTEETYIVGRKDGKQTLRSDRVVKIGFLGQEKKGIYLSKSFNGLSGHAKKIGSTGAAELVSYSPLKIEGLNWVINTTAAQSDALILIKYIINDSVIIMIAAICFIIILSYFFALELKKPIQHLKIITDEIRDGKEIKRDNKIENYKDTKDEITLLENSFFDMLSKLEKATVSKDLADKLSKEAQTVSVAKSEFLATMSHEIRTPMNAVLGMTEILMSTNLNIEQNEYLKIINNSGKSLLEIINNILDFSKIESGKLSLDFIDFELQECIDDAIYSSSYLASQKGISLESTVHKDVPSFLYGDLTRIRQILINFLSNAVKFTNKGGVHLQVDCEKIKNNDDTLKINFTIKDTGIGISRKNQKKLFKAFNQADNTITRQFGGTGLGLSIVSKLSKMMKATINIKSEEGLGSIFSITIPLKKGSLILKENLFDEKTSPSISLSEIFPHKLLVVEDHPINQKLISLMLKRIGYHCKIANNGQEALDLLAADEVSSNTSPFSIIFMDMQMPVMDGVTATKEIIKRYKDKFKIIAMTANAFQDDKEKCFKAGMVDFITKPISSKEIRRVLGNFNLKINVKEKSQLKMDHFNCSKLSSAFSGDEDVMVELLNEFISQIPENINQINKSIDQSDFKNLEILFHTLKGLAANFYADDLKKLSFDLEHLAKTQDLAKIKDLIDHYKENIQLLINDFELYLKDPSLNKKENS